METEAMRLYKLRKIADKQLSSLGYNLICDVCGEIEYSNSSDNEMYSYARRICLTYSENSISSPKDPNHYTHLIRSHEYLTNQSVPIPVSILNLCIKKMKEEGWKINHMSKFKHISADEGFADLGFIKLYDMDDQVIYEKSITQLAGQYCIWLKMIYNESGEHTIQIHEKLNNRNIPINVNEAMLCLKKMKEKGWIK